MYKLKNLIPSVKSFFENSDKANEYTNRPDPFDEDDGDFNWLAPVFYRTLSSLESNIFPKLYLRCESF